MFGIFQKKPQGAVATFKIEGMHCPSCAMSIDGELEDTQGVLSANTNYAKAETKVEYDPEKVEPAKLKDAVKRAGYAVTE